MTDFILSIMDVFKGLFRLLKVDYKKFRIILWAKLTDDNRQEKSVVQRKSKKQMSNSLVWIAFIYAFIGVLVGAMLLGIQDLFVSMVFVFAIIMVMTAMALISDFTSVLLDTTDNAILLPRPVDGRTLVVARLAHIVIYILLITLSLSAATIAIGTFKLGPVFTLVFLLSLIFSVLFVVFVANVFYLLLMKISGGEHFRDIILYFQIFMAAFALGSYQLLPRLIKFDVLKNFTFPIRWWTYLVPPAWMAAPIDAAVSGDLSGPKIALSLLGLLVPLASIVVVVRFLAPGFNRALSRMETAGSAGRKDQGKRGRETWNLPAFFSRLLTSNPAERAVFQLSWRLSSRDRKFKLKTYPTFGYMLIIVFVLSFFVGDEGNILQQLQSLPQTQKYIIFLYIGCIVIPIVVLQQRFSDQYEAAWVYHVLPFAKPGDIQKGSLKAMIVKYGFPVFAPLVILVLLVWGPAVIDDIVLAFMNMVITSLVLAFIVRGDLPFSRRYGGAAETQRGLSGFLMFLVPAFLGLIHFLMTFIPYAIPVGILIAAGIIYVGMKAYGNIGWQTIRA
jgi:ABC-2 type transport system permease protein